MIGKCERCLKVSLMVAMDKNRVIGKDNDIPWWLPKDWEYVKNTTLGHPIILERAFNIIFMRYPSLNPLYNP